ncbi:JmjC domain-containing protein [Fusarium sp. Ph1]|nr:JmjC domain-containing protein [Fusarium sp. Ph1]
MSDRSPKVNATASPEAISDAAQQPRLHPADGHGENSPRSPLPQDSGAAKQVGNAVAQESSIHQRREAEPENQVPANTHGDNATTDMEASRDTSSDGSDKDTLMRDYDEVQPSPPGSTATLLPVAQGRCTSPNDSASNYEPPATPNLQGKAHGTTPQGSDTTEDTSRATTPDTPLTSPGPSVPDSPPQLTLSEADMGERLVETLGRIIERDDSMHKISVPNRPVDLDLISAAVKARLRALKPDWQFTANRFVPGPKGEGYVHAYISKHRSHFAFPDFPDEVVIPTKEEARNWLDDYFNNPPKGIVPYFTGHLDLPYEELLNPGAAVLENPKLLDLHRPYWHIGGDKSANRFHIEDYNCSDDESPCGLRSANLVLEGVKLWTCIEMHHTRKFEAFVAKNWDCNECSQRVGHQSLLISPLMLEREGIDFVIEVQGPGDLILPAYGQLHMVVNMGFNIAMSINHLQRGDRLKSTALRQCVKCGILDDSVTRVPPPKSSEPRTPLPSIADPPPEQSEAGSPSPTLLGKRPRADHQGTQTSGRGARACTAARRKLNALEEEIRKVDPDCRIPQIPRDSVPPGKAFKAAASVQSSLAVKRFVSLVGEWRRRDKDAFLSSGTGHTVLQHGKRLVDLVGRSSLTDFLYRHAQACVARQLDLQVKKRGSMRRSKEDTEQLARQLGMKTEGLKAHLEEGRIWNSICGPEDDGLLPFIIAGFKEEDTLSVKEKCPLHIKKKEWRSLAGNPQEFLELLDVGYVENLRQAGRAFEKMVTTGSEQVFRWEKEGLDTQADGWDSLLCQVDYVADE